MGDLVVLLSGGGGGAKLAEGLAALLSPERLVIVGNTGDDLDWYGLRICPDLDTLLYTLAGEVDPRRGWGIRGDTFAVLERLAAYGEDPWFRVGDRDLATALVRTAWLEQGMRLTEVMQRLGRALGVPYRILPMTDDPVRTMIQTPQGEMDFQTYFVRRGHRDSVQGIRFAGIEEARPTPEVLEALEDAGIILLGPSNPFVSIGPILAVPGIRNAIRRSPARKAAISPLVAGQALKGPADAMMRTLGHRPDAVGVAALYRDLVEVFILDAVDAALAPEVERMGLRAVVAETVMRTPEDRRVLARHLLEMMEVRE
ncbi:MAG: 2-phospho-L-lactate transferase [Armatimonadetes bacterium]|nr:2-phospho-L-lactate transferase [Armatimonadota bacterium]MDW8153392.1 2-phospho-L-lactate transferase [Armatimonadota bacterium]